MKIIRFCFTHKTASMFGHRILKTISEERELLYFSPNNQPPNHTEIAAHIQNGSNSDLILFGPARTYGVSEMLKRAIGNGHELTDLCQIRNPLDIIVSQYFSHGWIHPMDRWSEEALKVRKALQENRLSMFDYAQLELEGKSHFAGVSIIDKFKALDAPFEGKRRLILKYEQFYQDYDAWSQKLADFLPDSLGVLPLLQQARPDYSKAVVLESGAFYADPLKYVETFDIRSGKHIRSAAPDDYLHFLTPKEIGVIVERLTEACPFVMSQYDLN